MTTVSRVALFGKLNSLLYKAIEAATVLAKLRGNPTVELSHWLYQLFLLDDSDLHRMLKASGCDHGRLLAQLLATLERLPAGANGIEDLSGDIDRAVERAWIQASVRFGASAVRSSHLMIALLADRRLREVLVSVSREFAAIDPEALGDKLVRIIADSPENASSAADQAYGGALAAPGDSAGATAPAVMGRGEALKRYTVDLTARARAGEIDPVTGRDDEIRQVVDILMRRRQNNPILTGEAGVGKTAVAEGFALRIASGEVPPPLREVELRSLDIGLLQAGASMKGEFEQRLRQLIEEVQQSERPVILFIDEIHSLVGAGGASGTGDAANLLKPALARGTLRTIGATTWSEYKRYIEKDPALTRRFQVVQVHEPDEVKAAAMLRGVVAALERHHGVSILDEAVSAAVSLSHRYIPARHLPDKAVALLDTASARVAISLSAMPAPLEDVKRRIEVGETERARLLRESAVGLEHAERIAKIDTALVALNAKAGGLTQRWVEERELVERIVSLRKSLLPEDAADGEADGLARADAAERPATEDQIQAQPVLGRPDLIELEAQLRRIRGECPLVSSAVDEQVVATVVADWTGIPVGRMVHDELKSVLTLAGSLEARVVGQRHALETVARRIQTARARLSDPVKPVGVFLLCGPSGVGKTETALALAEALYGGEQNLISVNMSEFQEAHTVSTLKGAPPGYVGFGEGGVLTEAVRRRPYSVVLLDEVEKAHPDVHEIFYQVFDKGRMEDGEGREIDFRNTVILLTSNIGTELIATMCQDPARQPEPEALAEALRTELLEVFPPALLGRLIVVPYVPLSDETLERIVRLQLDRVQARVMSAHGARFDYDERAVQLVIDRCNVAASGGRMIDAVLTNSVLPDISRTFLSAMVEGQAVAAVRLSVDEGGFALAFDGPQPEASVGDECTGSACLVPEAALAQDVNQLIDVTVV